MTQQLGLAAVSRCSETRPWNIGLREKPAPTQTNHDARSWGCIFNPGVEYCPPGAIYLAAPDRQVSTTPFLGWWQTRRLAQALVAADGEAHVAGRRQRTGMRFPDKQTLGIRESALHALADCFQAHDGRTAPPPDDAVGRKRRGSGLRPPCGRISRKSAVGILEHDRGGELGALPGPPFASMSGALDLG